MFNLVDLYGKVRAENIPGDFVETGVWKGANGIVFALVRDLVGETSTRSVYNLDSFRWLPPPRAIHKRDVNDKHSTYANKHVELRASLDLVIGIYRRYGIDVNDPAANVHMVEGWFNETAPAIAQKVQKIAILRLDGDMYGSTWEVLIYLYGKVAVGGYVIIDDYKLPGCRAAVDEFRDCLKITSPLVQIKVDDYLLWHEKPYWKKNEELPDVLPKCFNIIPANRR